MCVTYQKMMPTGNDLKKVEAYAATQGAGAVIISAAIESEVAQLDTEEKQLS